MELDKELAFVRGEPLTSYPSIYHHLEIGLNRNPDGPAISIFTVIAHQARDHLSQLAGVAASRVELDGDCLVWTHTQLRRAAVRVASGLVASGIQRGSRLVTLIANGVEWAVLHYAATICGATFVPLDSGALTRPREMELRNFMRRLEPDAVVVGSEDDAHALESSLSEELQSSLRVRVALDGPHESDSNWISLSHLAGVDDKGLQDEQKLLQKAKYKDPDRISLIAFTSGTSSGTPKGCPRHAGGDSAAIDSQAQALLLDETSRYLFASANFRIIAPTLSLAVWSKGGAIVMPGPAFNPSSIMDAFQKHHITHVLFVPAQLHILTKNEFFSPEKTKSLKYAFFGADMITKELLKKAERSFPTAKIGARHGMTEGGALFNWPFYGVGVDGIPDFKGICALGTVAPGIALRIYDIENNRIAKRDEPGEFQMSSPTTIKRYLENVDQEAFVEDETGRWFRTGDVGLINKDSIVFLLGRLNDRIKRAGIRIAPAALEISLSQYLGSQVSVFGIPHPELGQEPYAVAESFNGKTEDEVKQHVVDLFGADYSLAGACKLEQLGLAQFPLNSTGKIMKIKLREAVVAYLGR